MFGVFDEQLDLKQLKRPSEPTKEIKKKKQAKVIVQDDPFVHQSSRSVRHEVCIPEGTPYTSINDHIIENRYREWPFELDPFQEIAVRAIDRRESVLVAAHTSAGKTVTAEYAIAMALKNRQRVVYTSPIKALSNQKYQDFKKIFHDVGLLTGDNTINESSSCLVMTTEILRSMFYLGSEVFRETSVIIFDEVHYLRDSERGVVWEESILLAPPSARFVFLSATIPNATQFARWITHEHQHTTHVVYTDFRPVPLTHFIYPLGGDRMYKVYEQEQFYNDQFQSAMKDIANSSMNRKKLGVTKALSKINQMDENPVEKVVKLLTKKELDPVIMFCFSKKECEQYAIRIKTQFITEDESDAIDVIYSKAIGKLEEEDRLLPQVESLLPILKRGIGIHHSGMLPLLKEVVEILFGRHLIKVLFATETFSIGLNMPARTCCFTGLKKFDGKEMRLLSSGEWIQMSGRAGRRGLDDRGLCVMMVDDHIESDQLQGMITGESLPLNSAFRLTYHMLLNLSRVEGIQTRDLIQSSFMQYQQMDALPALQVKLKELQKQLVDVDDSVATFVKTEKDYQALHDKIQPAMAQKNILKEFMKPGRLVHVAFQDKDFGWGIVHELRGAKKKCTLNVLLRVQRPGKLHEGRSHKHVVDSTPAITTCNAFELLGPTTLNEEGHFVIVPCYLDCIHHVSTVRVNLPTMMMSDVSREACSRILKQVKSKYGRAVPLFDLDTDMCVHHPENKVYHDKINWLATNEVDQEAYLAYKNQSKILDDIAKCEQDIKEAQSIMALDEHESRMAVLKRLGYVTDNGTIELKGRVACEISAGDAVLLTELMLNGFFASLTPEVLVALLSCVVFGEKYDENVPMPSDMTPILNAFYDKVRELARIQVDCGLEIDLEACTAPYRNELVPVALAWSQGTSFVDVCKMTDVYEGSIVRMFRRLDELLRQLKGAAHVLGDEDLSTKIEVASKKVTRGIVFTESLYL